MNPADVGAIARYAKRQLANDATGCILQADKVADLTAAYADAMDRLAQIAAIIERTWAPFCDHDREAVQAALHEIEELAQLPLDKLTQV